MRGAAAGAIAAAAWAAGEPALGRLVRTPTPMCDRSAGSRNRAWPMAGAALHLVNGAAFGPAYELAGLRGVKAGITAAEAENLAFWPAFAVLDRVHPHRRDGSWPPLLRRRIAPYEVIVHALFGSILGALVRRPRSCSSRATCASPDHAALRAPPAPPRSHPRRVAASRKERP